MAWAHVGQIVNAGNKSAASSLSSGAITAGVSVGDVVVVMVSCDNAATTNSNSTTVTSVTDTKANTYTKIGERTTSSGSAADGICCAVFVGQLNAALVAASDSFTVTLSASVTTKQMSAERFTIAAAHSWTQAGATQTGSSPGTTVLPSLTVGGLTNAEHLWVALDAWESTGITYTQDVDYTTIDTRQTTGGSALTNIQQAGGFRIATLTTDTHAGTLGTAEDGASVYFALTETGPVQTPVTLTVTATSAPVKNQRTARLVPQVGVTTSTPGLPRLMVPRLLTSVTSTTTLATVKHIGRILQITASAAPLLLKLGKPILVPGALVTSAARSTMPMPVRALTASLTPSRASLKVLPHALAVTVTTTSTAVRTVQTTLSYIAGATVAVFKQQSYRLATSVVSLVPGVSFTSHSSLVSAQLVTAVSTTTSAARSIGRLFTYTVTAAPPSRTNTCSLTLLTSPTLLTGTNSGGNPGVLHGHFFTMTVTATTKRIVSLFTSRSITAGIAGVFTFVTTGAPRVLSAAFSGSNREATTMTGTTSGDQAAASGDAETATITGGET